MKHTPRYRDRYGDNALVIGASETIGEQFCRQLAARGMRIYLVARNATKLRCIASDIERQFGVETEVIVLDLLSEGALERLFEQTGGVVISYLVINANLHKINEFDLLPTRVKLDMLHMNVIMPTLLCDHYGRKMVAQGRGGIFLISAMNYLMGLEKDAVFQGSKAYVALFSESLWLEYRKKGVHVASALVNGIEGSTSYQAKTSLQTRKALKTMGIAMAPERIVAACLRGFERGQPIVIPDYRFPFGRIFYFFMSLSKLLRFGWYNRFLSALTLRFLNGEHLSR